MPTEYKLTTLRDVYERVPQDKIEICMREIAQGMLQARGVQSILTAAAEAMEPGTEAKVEWPAECTWIDDDTGTVGVQVVDDVSDEPLLTLTSHRA